MYGTNVLDLKNTYVPNLQVIFESAMRTLGEANSFYRRDTLYLEDILRRFNKGELVAPEDLYDECHAEASSLAQSCEMFLKAIYIYEHNVTGNNIEDLWKKLKESVFEVDNHGNLIYKTFDGKITFSKYDSNGNQIVDSSGMVIYYDIDGNTYNERTRGSKIKKTGHQLDRLIDMLSPESRLLLETRMLNIPMNATEMHDSVTILDYLQKHSVFEVSPQITSAQYTGWIEQHKRAFEEARYSGQIDTSVNVEFLYHLATQLRAVARYKIVPTSTQKFAVSEEELKKLPSRIRELFSFHSFLVSEELIKLIANDEQIKYKFEKLLSKPYILPSEDVKRETFLEMVKTMTAEEIEYVSYICWAIKNYNPIRDNLDLGEDIKRIANQFSIMAMSPDRAIHFLIELKKMKKDFLICSESILEYFDNIGDYIVKGIPNTEFNNWLAQKVNEERDKYTNGSRCFGSP